MKNSFVDRSFETITFNVLDKGLGIHVIGGNNGVTVMNKHNFGIFIKKVLSGGLAAIDGRLMVGDQIINVNGESFLAISIKRAIDFLKKSSGEGFVQMKICRDQISRKEFRNLLDSYVDSSSDTNLEESNGNGYLQVKKDTNIPNSFTNNVTKISESLSIDPSIRLDLEKLKLSLQFLGIHPTMEEENELKKKLKIDNNGTVAYGDFVEIVKKLFFKKLIFSEKIKKFSRLNAQEPDNLNEKITQNLTPAALQNENLKHLLKNKQLALSSAENDLYSIRKQLQQAMDEVKNYKNKLKLLEEAQRLARETEEDYEVILRSHEKLNKGVKQIEKGQMEKLQEFEYNVKMLETSRNFYIAANEKLMAFTKFIMETLYRRKQQKELFHINNSINKNSRINTNATENKGLTHLDYSGSDDLLRMEAENTLYSIHELLDIETLPPGWEIIKTNNDDKVFVNIFNNSISPIHPLLISQKLKKLHPIINIQRPNNLSKEL